MRRRIVHIFLLLLTAGPLSALSQTQPKAGDRSLLWEISGKNLAQPSYLFGTYHYAGKQLLDSMPQVKTHFDRCKTVVGELVIDGSLSTRMAFSMLLRGGTLKNLFTAKEYSLVDGYVREISEMELEQMNTLKPAAVQMILSGYISPSTVSDENPALDQFFQDQARKEGKKVIGLETAAEQIDLLLNAPVERQKFHLLYMVRNKIKLKGELARLYRLYRQQDVQAIGRMMYAKGEFLDNEIDVLLVQRNRRWAEQLPPIMQAQPAFIAVGAGHLGGPDGLITMLRKKGYVLKPVW
ncbi:MAG: TraB/GumN family protein [Mucilaginibacter polytrichastri]|nr:TraB/GumN family protein [Mucilaginibacter polytrichastri]